MVLSDRLFNSSSFQKQYQALLKMSGGDQLPNLKRKESREYLLSLIDWENLISIASVFSFSENPKCASATLRIVQACLFEDSCTENLKNACGLILENLTNQQCLNLAIRKKLLHKNYSDSLSLSGQISRLSTLMGSNILSNNQLIQVNHFQKQVFDKFFTSNSLSISAPTSSGKSYILGRLLLHAILDKGEKCIVYVVPSRALIAQVEKDLRDWILVSKDINLKINISSIPPRKCVLRDQINIFVFTQERLHWYLNSDFSIPIDLIIVDEAQKIEDSSRGILLQETIERVFSVNPNVFMLFASPFTSNPEIFFHDFDICKTEYDVVSDDFVSVNQNLYYLKQRVRKPTEYEVTFITDNGSYELGTVVLSANKNGDLEKLAAFAEELGENAESNLIYANGKANAEKVALNISASLPEIQNNDELDQLIDLVKRVIHPKYRLVQSLKKGVAFHYGNLPIIVRTEIENLFSKGILKYLVCTSTLLEGVNTPAKNLFLLNPKKGKSPLSNSEFWNLAGRAGRAGREFSGNIFCVNPEKWDSQYSKTPQPKKVKSFLNKITSEESFEKSLETGDRLNSIDRESALGYYFIRFLEQKKLGEIKNDSTYDKLMNFLEKQSKKVTLPARVLVKNFSVSPLKQQALVNSFGSYKKKDINELIPLDPYDSKAFMRYSFILSLITDNFSLNLSKKQQKRLVTLALKWMKGYPLWKIIDEALQNNENGRGEARIIRDTMMAIEEDIRFKFLSYMTCYTDLLGYYIDQSIQEKEAGLFPDVCLWLELGVSRPVQILLMQLGLSRSTSIELTKVLDKNIQSKEDCIKELKLKLNELREKKLPKAMYREVEDLLKMES